MNNTCYDTILTDLENGRRNCSCSVDCDEEDYIPMIAGSTYPELKYKVIVMFKFKSQVLFYNTINNSRVHMFINIYIPLNFKDIAHESYGNGPDEEKYVKQQGHETGHNLLKVNIYYQHLNVMKIEESPEYDVRS